MGASALQVMGIPSGSGPGHLRMVADTVVGRRGFAPVIAFHPGFVFWDPPIHNADMYGILPRCECSSSSSSSGGSSSIYGIP